MIIKVRNNNGAIFTIQDYSDKEKREQILRAEREQERLAFLKRAYSNNGIAIHIEHMKTSYYEPLKVEDFEWEIIYNKNKENESN